MAPQARRDRPLPEKTMGLSIEEYAEHLSKRRFRRKRYEIAPARIAGRVRRIERVEAVLWDVYGTLMALAVGDLASALEKQETMLGAFRRTIREFRLSKFLDGAPPDTLLRMYVGEIEKTHRRKIARGVSSPEVKIERIWLRILQRLESKGYAANGGETGLEPARRIAYFFDDVYQTKALYPGARETLEGVKKLGLRQGIISNAQFYTPIALNILLRRAGHKGPDPHADLFDRRLVFYSYRLGVSKPNPFAFERARKRLRAMGIAPDRVLYVGNDALNDMIPARKVGFRTALFAGDKESLKLRKDRPECASFRADVVIKSLPQLLQIIG